MAEDEVSSEEQYELPVSVGQKLRAAREAKGLSLAQVSAETRITQRHLGLIEAGAFTELPGRSYATGFARTYAKMVGLDDQAVAHEVRSELAASAPRDIRAMTFEPGDPGRVPSSRLAWVSAIGGVVLVIGVLAFAWTSFISPGGSLPWLTSDQKPAPAPATVAKPVAAAPTGAVVFTALENGVWIKFYDADDRQLMQGEMLQGESYTVPSDVVGPQMSTARPTALAITVGGKPLPPLAATDAILKDVPVTAAALIARVSTPPTQGPVRTSRSARSSAPQNAAATQEATAEADEPVTSPTA